MTQYGRVSYGYHSMNRLTSAGPVAYSYSPGENKRRVVYSNISPTPQLNMYLCGPNGKVLSKFLFEPSGPAWDAVPGSQTNYFYLGTKALNWAENNVGSNAASQFWPYGQGSGVFATYQPDPSGFLYADQRYYNSGWGRFLTADPSDQNINPATPGSYNRYAYVNGDPANGIDANGLGDGPGYGCVCETPDSMDCSDATPPGATTSAPPITITINIPDDPPPPLPDVPTYLATDGGPNDPTAASQSASPSASGPIGSAPAVNSGRTPKSPPPPEKQSLKFSTGLQVSRKRGGSGRGHHIPRGFRA